MTDQIQPALTPEEWKEFPCVDNLEMHSDGKVENNCCGCTMPKRHALAAACLHQQPYGFTHKDVAWLRSHAYWLRSKDFDFEEVDAMLDSIADRIEALLPPESIEGPTYEGEDGG